MQLRYFGTLEDLNDRTDLILVTDSQDVTALKDYFGNPSELNDFCGFFVKVSDGEYTEVYAFVGTLPYLYKAVFEVVFE